MNKNESVLWFFYASKWPGRVAWIQPQSVMHSSSALEHPEIDIIRRYMSDVTAWDFYGTQSIIGQMGYKINPDECNYFVIVKRSFRLSRNPRNKVTLTDNFESWGKMPSPGSHFGITECCVVK